MLSNTVQTRILMRFFYIEILPAGILEPIENFQEKLLVSLEETVESGLVKVKHRKNQHGKISTE